MIRAQSTYSSMVYTASVTEDGKYPRGGGGGTLIFSCIRRLRSSFFLVQNFEFQYFLEFSEKIWGMKF